MEPLRLFIAIHLPDEIKQNLEKIQSLLKSGTTAPVKWVNPGDMHLTLKFLGDTESEKIAGISSALREAAVGISHFRLEVKNLGVFPNTRNTQVAWAGFDGELEQLNRLQENLETGLEKLGLAREKRRFSPHLTLARVRDRVIPEDRERFGRLVTGTSIRSLSFTADSVHLIQSQLTGQGPIYTRLDSVVLK